MPDGLDQVRISYFKRYRMEVGLEALPAPRLPPDYRFMSWGYDTVSTHAEVLFDSFHQEIDSKVFASLGDRLGCVTLITEISRKLGFLPEATWLLVGPGGFCGTVQGIRERAGVGAIQNLGITPTWRGRGLGTALLLQALQGFRRGGLARAMLEVTAQNETAIRIYRRLGFRCCKTLYKAAPDLRPVVPYY